MAEPIEGPYKYGFHGKHDHSIWAANGQVKVADVRGWGHLIGTGGMNLPAEEAAAIHDANGHLLADSWEMREENKKLRAALQHIADMTDPDDGDNYRADDREGCIDMTYSVAANALASAKGETK